MKPERMEVAEGVFLNILECDKFKTNYISVDFICRLSRESAAENALLPFVLKRGSAAYPTARALSRRLEMLYGSGITSGVTHLGDLQVFGFYSYPLRDDYAEGNPVTLELLSMIGQSVTEPYTENGLLSAGYVESEKRILIDNIRANINDKDSYAMLRCRELVGEGTPYAIPDTGSEEEVAAVTPEALTRRLAHAREHYRIEIWWIGSFGERSTRKDLLDTVRKYFVSPGRDGAEKVGYRVLPAPDGEAKAVTEPQPVRQGKLCLGYRTGIGMTDPEMPAFLLFNRILGSSPVAKLFMNVRERMSLCYYCYSLPDTCTGVMMIGSGIEVADRERTEEAIAEQIDACRRGEITEEELSAAKKNFAGSLRNLYDDAGSLKSWYMKRLLGGLSGTPEELDRQIGALSVPDIAAVAGRLTPTVRYFLAGTLTEENTEEEKDHD